MADRVARIDMMEGQPRQAGPMPVTACVVEGREAKAEARVKQV
jgi:hypothetical protein